VQLALAEDTKKDSVYVNNPLSLQEMKDDILLEEKLLIFQGT
jgi:hypothetical protein